MNYSSRTLFQFVETELTSMDMNVNNGNNVSKLYLLFDRERYFGSYKFKKISQTFFVKENIKFY